MSTANFPLMAQPDPEKDRLVSLREATHVARNITSEVIGPMSTQLQYVADMLRRLVGDPLDADIPPELQHKGALHDMREEQLTFRQEQLSFFEEQRAWKAENDKEDDVAKLERADIIRRLTKLEKSGVIRRVAIWFVRWLTRKDDGFSIAVAKLMLALTVVGTGAIGSYQILLMLLKKIIHLFFGARS